MDIRVTNSKHESDIAALSYLNPRSNDLINFRNVCTCMRDLSLPLILDVDRYLPSVHESLPDNEGWIRINGSFVGLNFLTISHMGADGVYFAEQEIDSDYIVVHLMPPDMSRSEMIRLMTTSFNGHATECAKTGISFYVKAFRITLDEESSKLPYMWSIEGESFEGMRIFQGQLHSQGYPILALPPVPRNPINHAPDFL
ncbi:unnamed protein product [Hymenolepis diminuta]|uniref:Similar to n=1 Tax=Hymenolepis diminuta TaxID=6216 RepID=A0A0R3SKA9_HYMDI|nr:unnamed protein product [Hymenolepis diminuta]VUZ56616.1 unnamed protein product [Hymenolepis diminuta]